MDMKLNPLQWSKGECERKVKSYNYLYAVKRAEAKPSNKK